jgi:putative ABC transport system substrate-binding protein
MKTLLLLLGLLLAGCAAAQTSPPVYRVGVLMSGDIRQEPLNGLKDGLAERGFVEGDNITFDVKNAAGNRDQLPELAQQIIDSRPHLAIATGGIEADALKAAAAGTRIPVLFLAVSSAVERGLIADLKQPGGNLTGVDTNDTQLTAKRLELLTRLLPKAKKVLIFHVPSITPSTRSVAVAQETAPVLGLELEIIEVENQAEIEAVAATVLAEQIDAILLLPVAPIQQAVPDILYPLSVEQQIPIFGVNRQDVDNGALAAYATSRYNAGVQAARLAAKILDGALPADTPAETPQQLEFIINRGTAKQLAIDIPDDIWRLADEIVDADNKGTP